MDDQLYTFGFQQRNVALDPAAVKGMPMSLQLPGGPLDIVNIFSATLAYSRHAALAEQEAAPYSIEGISVAEGDPALP